MNAAKKRKARCMRSQKKPMLKTGTIITAHHQMNALFSFHRHTFEKSWQLLKTVTTKTAPCRSTLLRSEERNLLDGPHNPFHQAWQVVGNWRVNRARAHSKRAHSFQRISSTTMNKALSCAITSFRFLHGRCHHIIIIVIISINNNKEKSIVICHHVIPSSLWSVSSHHYHHYHQLQQ